MFKGVYTALITPFLNGEVDYNSLEKIIDNQLSSGIQGLVVCGTTAESPTLTKSEQFEILKFVCDKVNKKVPIIFGSGSNSTEKTLSHSLKAQEFAIDGLLVVVPYYNKPPQQGLLQHFTTIADGVDKPVILYNVPGRTVTALEPKTIIELSQHPNIKGIKEANNDLNNFSMYKSAVADDFSLLSGDDESCVNFCLLGGNGVISVCSHVAPKQMVNWINQAINKEEAVREEFRQQLSWIQSLYLSSNPVPVKYALKNKGLITSEEVRLPLTTMSEELKSKQDLIFSNQKELL